MSLYTAALASGSNGNCYFVGNEQEGVLIDVGISCTEIEFRMERLGIPISIIKAIFITHEHSDHIKGLNKFAKKHKLPVFITLGTWESMQTSIPGEQVFRIQDQQIVKVGSLQVLPFRKLHDAAEPVSFIVSQNGIQIGVLTDIGLVSEEVKRRFSNCHIAYLEFNYETELLNNGRYPYFLKKRIQGGLGHLSNQQAFDLYEKFRSPKLRLLIASHLSGQNNSPEIVQAYFNDRNDGVQLEIASREVGSGLYKIDAIQTLRIQYFQYQYSLFT